MHRVRLQQKSRDGAKQVLPALLNHVLACSSDRLDSSSRASVLQDSDTGRLNHVFAKA
jgi:hypothetical protein